MTETPSTTTAQAGQVRRLLAAEIAKSAPLNVRKTADQLSSRPGVAAVLFYGNMLRDNTASGLLDLYVLTDGDRAYHGFGFSAAANHILPPNVYFESGDPPAKVAVMTLSAFRARMESQGTDTTLWARFSQPVRLVWRRDEATEGAVLDALEAAVEAAAWWAARLVPEEQHDDPAACWTALFRATYDAELRVEGFDRAQTLIAASPERYRALHAALIGGHPIERLDAQALWRRRRRVGKALNLLRLSKAAFTFRGGISYALAKVERHGGAPVELRAWERRLPWLAAPGVMLRLIRQRRLR